MDVLKKFDVVLRGISPLIMHSDKLCNPLDPLVKAMKEISSVKKKTDEHYAALAKLEFLGGLYYDEEIGIYLPCKVIMGVIKAAARKYKLGKMTKGITLDAAIGFPLIGYEETTPEKLWEEREKNGDQKHVFSETVVVQVSRIMRTRGIFKKWAVAFKAFLNSELLSPEQFKQILDTAGFEYGVGECRPGLVTGNYGRFRVEKFTELK